MSHLIPTVMMRVVLVAFLAVATVMAAPASVATAEPTAYANLGVSLLVRSHSGAPLLLVSAVLPDDVPLPAEVVLPVPDGAQIEWAGEIVGQTIEEDIEAEVVVEQGEFGPVVVIPLTVSRIAQVEVVFSDAVVPGQDGASTGSFSLVSPVAVDAARLAIALPPGGELAELPEGMLVSPGPDSYTYYYTDLAEVGAGDSLELGLGYTLSAVVQPSAPPMSAPSSEVPPLLVVVIAAAIAGALLMLLASRARRSSAASDDAVAVAEDTIGDEVYAVSEVEMHAGIAPTVPGAAEAAVPLDGATPAPAQAFLTPKMLVIIAAVLVLGLVLVMNLTGESSQVGVLDISDGWVNQRISTAEVVQQVDYQVRISCECPPELEAPKIFEALSTLSGVATGSLNQSTLVLRVGYDPALTSEDAIAGVLRSKGYLP